jgi:hypothetical protein
MMISTAPTTSAHTNASTVITTVPPSRKAPTKRWTGDGRSGAGATSVLTARPR